MRKPALPAVIGLALCLCAPVAGALTPAEATQHIGESATVCGTVAGAHYARATEGQPTFVNLDQPYPNQVFTIVVWGDYRGKFQTPPETWAGHLCATGKISAYRGKVEMKVFGPQQIRH